jgi:site-specific DNA recombinase
MPRNFDQGCKPKRVAIYARVSSVVQRVETSIAEQIQECREAARRQGWIVMEKYVRSDKAKSGKFLSGRDGLDDLMNLAEQKEPPFDGIVMYDTSRFGRNLTDGLGLTDRLKYARVFLFFTNCDLDSRDKNFRTLFIQYGSKDEQSSSDTADRVHRGQRGRVRKGYIASGRLYGYKNVPVPRADGTKWRHGRAAVEGVRREIINEEAAVVTRIFEMYAAGLGQQAIAIKLNEEGIPAPAKAVGRPQTRWCTTTISFTLKNTRYIGINTWNKTQVIPNPKTHKKEVRKRPESEWERVDVPEWRIVSNELWNAVADENRRRQGAAAWRKGGLNRTDASRGYIFSGLLSCEICGKPFMAFRTSTQDVRYACGGWRCGTCANNKSISLPLVDSQLLPAISQCVREASVRDQLATTYRDQMVFVWNEHMNSRQRVVEIEVQLREKRQDLGRRANNIVDSLQDDGPNPLLIERLNSIQEELTDIDRALATTADVVTPPLSEEQTLELVARKLADIDTALEGEPKAVKHRLAKHIDELKMKLVETPEGPRYQVTGQVRLFAPGDKDDVLLTGSSQRTCKQYTPLSFPLKASLIVRAGEWEKQAKSAATRKKIGDANRMRWAERKRAKAAKA